MSKLDDALPAGTFGSGGRVGLGCMCVFGWEWKCTSAREKNRKTLISVWMFECMRQGVTKAWQSFSSENPRSQKSLTPTQWGVFTKYSRFNCKETASNTYLSFRWWFSGCPARSRSRCRCRPRPAPRCRRRGPAGPRRGWARRSRRHRGHSPNRCCCPRTVAV